MTTSDELAALAEGGRRIIEAAILRLLEAHPEGLGNAQIARLLGLRSSFRADHKDFLTYSLMRGLLTKGLVERDETNKSYTAAVITSGELTVLAEEGRRTMETAILRLLEAHPQGLRNVDIAESLGLQSTSKANQRNRLTLSLMGGLLTKGLVEQDETSKLYTKV